MKKILLGFVIFIACFFFPVFCPVSFAETVIDGYRINHYNVIGSSWRNTSSNMCYALDSNRHVNGSYVNFPYIYGFAFVPSTGSQDYTFVFYAVNGDGYYGSRFDIRGDIQVRDGSIISDQQLFFSNFRTNNFYNYNGVDITYYSLRSSTQFRDFSFPVIVASNVTSALDYVFEYFDYTEKDLGYISDVKYFVDSAAYLYNQSDTPEYIQWGDTSTSGIDLSDSRYQVEFALEDQSTFLRNSMSDSWVDQAGIPFASAVSLAKSKLEFASSYIFPAGSDQRALMQGKAAKTSLYGQWSGIGTVSAAAKLFKFSCAEQYKIALENDSSSDKGIIYNIVSNFMNNNLTPVDIFFNQYQSSGKALNFTYNIYARIVDTASGTSGDWLKIDRHNSPFEFSNDDRFLNGGVTVSGGHKYVNFDPTTNVFVTPPDDTGDPVKQPVGTGYTYITNEGDRIYQPVFNNTNYYYYTINNINNEGDTINNYYQNPDTDIDDDISNINQGIDTIKGLGMLSSLFALLFSGIVPSWAIAFSGVAILIVVAGVVWKIIKGVLPFV